MKYFETFHELDLINFLFSCGHTSDPQRRRYVKALIRKLIAGSESQKAKTFRIARFCRKNFMDKARKSRQFSYPRQMRIKGGFARFWIIQLDFLDDLDTF